MDSCEVIVQEAPVPVKTGNDEKIEDADPHSSDVFQPSGFRRSFCFGDGMDKLLLDNRFIFFTHQH